MAYYSGFMLAVVPWYAVRQESGAKCEGVRLEGRTCQGDGMRFGDELMGEKD